MIILRSFLFVIVLYCMNSAAEDGHCIWYGQCGVDELGKVVNCYDNSTARLLTDPTALQEMETACSMFYQGPNATYTCCAPDQISTMVNQFGVAKMMLGRCPSCYYNFRSLFCATTCHPQQSRFVTVRSVGNSTLYPGKQTVESITSLLADDFPQRLLDSCRDVHYPGGNQHSLDAICGRPYDKCTKEDLLRYLGVDNPAVPFPIYFELTNNTAQTNYYNQSTFMCNEPVETSYDHQPMCTHYDCPSSPPHPYPPPDPPGKFSNMSLRTTQLIVVPDDQTFVTQYYFSPPAPFVDVLVGPALELGFLTQVLDLQKNIINLEALSPSDNRSIRLSDICLKPKQPTNENCAIFSVFQYFQNSAANLYKNLTDDFGEVLGDYITHIAFCNNPHYPINDPVLNTSCFAEFGGLISPNMVLSNYPRNGSSFISARALVITFVMEDSLESDRVEDAEIWEEAFLDFMQDFMDNQTALRIADRWSEMANFSVYYTNQHAIKRELNNMQWSDDHPTPTPAPVTPSNGVRSTGSNLFSNLLILSALAMMIRRELYRE